MAHPEQKVWCNYVKSKRPEFFKNVHVCDIGSLDINGNNRYLFEDYKFVGVDICPGRNVDVLSRGHEFDPLVHFDVVISSECFEHDQYYAETLQNIVHKLLRPGGMFIFTCATDGRHEHGTRRTSPADSPATQDYYMNVSEHDVRTALDIEAEFDEFQFDVNHHTHDLYFYGIKKDTRILQKSLFDIIKNKKDYTYDEPFRHHVIDGLFDDNMLKRINNPENMLSVKGNMTRFLNDKEDKIAISHIEQGEVFKVLSYLNSKEFLEFLQELTGVRDLIPDPQFNGGGIHMIPRGGKLNVHVDFSRALFDNNLYRRVNILLYMNEGWQDEWEGALELWDGRPADGGNIIKKVYPIFNRMIVFGTSKNSWHGHPTPLNCPEGEYRKSLAVYYYSVTPGDDLDEHSTVY